MGRERERSVGVQEGRLGMTDKNEAIARWMGWTWDDATDMWLRPEDEWEGWPEHDEIPDYEHSVDALVPVMEAMGVSKVDLEVGLSGNKLAILFPPEGPWDDWFDASGDSYAEALRDAIYAALVAMGENHE